MTPATICRACQHFIVNIAKCEFYLKRCSTQKLWDGKMPPPDKCPRRDELIEITGQ